MLVGRIAKALIGAAIRRQQNRALGSIGLGGWKLHLFRAVQAAMRQGRRGPGQPMPRPPRRDIG
ncbi:hypothetical protein SAMN02745194_04287 [Roseomonas rosea]|uniref:Uncharacterized protein n=1 Tax=Muricoccus roseus TaxID=198092 RepID=A0A1M6Q2D3_9PROT|nr:hypothetical protein [Roseomonas rosea]SHK14354.1 hypothetical protein SAMN02745194_04287 [Roseomonas rosea]